MQDTGHRRLAGALALAGLALTATLGAPAAGGADAADKRRFTLLRPTPEALMRELVLDRPDRTEGPFTVDAGHLQLESDLVSYAYDRDTEGGITTRVDTWAVAPLNLRVGLLNALDFHVILETWNHVRTRTSGALGSTTANQSGFGDLTLRLKWNLWGNDGGTTAFAVLPYLKLPTNQDGLGNDSVEGGLILPLAVTLPLGFGLGLMTEFDAARDETGDGHHAGFVNSISVSRDLVGPVGGYLEFYSAVSAEAASDWVGTVDAGLIWPIGGDVQLDVGVNVGVTDAADDVSPFAGIGWRF
jgi:hypothetical protein